MRMKGDKKEYRGENDPSILYACMEISQCNPYSVQLIFTNKKCGWG
jgi:hypothetical protein